MICPFIHAAEASFQYYFPVDAEYQLRLKMPGDNAKPLRCEDAD